MIDFEKLKLAHELALQTEDYYFEVCLGTDEIYMDLYDATKSRTCIVVSTECADDLISTIRQLSSSSKPRYQIGDEVYIVTKFQHLTDGIYHNKIIDIDADGEREIYTIKGLEDLDFSKEDIYPSKQSLIQAQIDYWTCIQKENSASALAPNYDSKENALQELMNHIQSAIESYCEHKSEVYECTTCHIHQCSKCGGHWR